MTPKSLGDGLLYVLVVMIQTYRLLIVREPTLFPFFVLPLLAVKIGAGVRNHGGPREPSTLKLILPPCAYGESLP